MADSSFDIVSEFDRQELVNAIDIAKKELVNRYDFKNVKTEIRLEEDRVIIQTQDEYKLAAVYDILQSKVIKRGLSLKIFDPQKVESAAGSSVRQALLLRQSLTADQCRELNKTIRKQFPKIKVQIQGDTLRVSDKSKDVLQGIIQFCKNLDFAAPLVFKNYR
ncbi:MAG TPA: YajQ family cyclic di-GMP-binding protein [Candidatus Wirthbacteria bacterium]|nr:YajQ family cyclic di-GMP-binding protein [Candidatus Wirthbacteria bacterium]